MKIVGVLSAYDESVSWIAAAVTGFARFCDAIVYADGSYALYPGARPRSNPEQPEAVLEACEAMNVECLVHRPRDIYWGNEVEKRNKTMQLAGSLDPDWVCVFDADTHVMRCETGVILEELADTDLNVATYTILSNRDVLHESPEMATSLPLSTDWTVRTRSIYRWTPDLRYGPAHYTVRGTYDGEEQWLFGPEMFADATVPQVEALDLREALVVHHRNKDRAMVRNDARLEYCRVRDLVKAESVEGWRTGVA